MFQKKSYRLIFTFFLICITGNATWAQKPTEAEKEILKKIKIIRVVVEESYGEANRVRLPFLGYSKRILDYGGFDVADRGETFDAVLYIRAEGYPKAIDFGTMGHRYSGAEIKGKLSLNVADKTSYTLPFSSSYADYVISSICCATPNDAPFEEVFKRGFLPALFQMLVDFKGMEPLIAALNDINSVVRSGAIRALGTMKDSRAIKPLILVALEDENSDVRSQASIALSQITGETFGNPSQSPHPSRWQEWWEKNKSEY